MKLSISKTDTIELEEIQDVGGTTRYGRQFNVQVGEDSGRLSEIINYAVRSQFEMPDAGRLFEGGRKAEKAADKIRPAIFREHDTQLLRMVYKELAIRFYENVRTKTRRKILEKFKLEVRRRGRYNKALHIVHDPNRKVLAQRVVEVSNELMSLDEVMVVSPNFVSEFPRGAPPTPSIAQWHLKFRSGTSQKTGSDVDIHPAWRITLGSPRIVVAILDDGVDVEHPNLGDNIVSRPDPSDPRDLVGRDFFISDDDHPEHFNPRPKRFRYPYYKMAGNDIHGTPCAGVVAANGRFNNIYGAAPRCKILPVKVFHADDLASEDRVADAIVYSGLYADILSCSWSGPNSSIIEAALHTVAEGAFDYRRGTRGTPIFFAAGNGGRNRVSYPAASDYAICVGATTDLAEIADYSNQGKEVWISAPSSGGVKGITTSDVSYPNRGFNIGDSLAGGKDGLHTNSFGGTSSATPLVAGIAALILSVRPDLTLADIKEILKDSADMIGPASSYTGDPGHSVAFGYGRINAGAAVEAALAFSSIAAA
jgi:subtilisin family serine protease